MTGFKRTKKASKANQPIFNLVVQYKDEDGELQYFGQIGVFDNSGATLDFVEAVEAGEFDLSDLDLHVTEIVNESAPKAAKKFGKRK